MTTKSSTRPCNILSQKQEIVQQNMNELQIIENNQKTMTTKELATVLNVDVSTIQKTVQRLNATSDVLPKYKQGQTPRFTEEQATLIEQEIRKQQKWYTIEDLASMCGMSVETLKKGNSPLYHLSVDFRVETRLGGYHNTKKFYSGNVLKALKEYQIKNSVQNATKNKETVLTGNVSYIQTDTFNKTIQGLLDNPDALLCLINESSKRIQALNTKLIEQQPKADYYDKFIDSTNLIEIGHLGKSTGIGEQKIFKRLVAEGFIKVRFSTDGVKYYDPCYGYEKYFKSISVPFLRGDKQLNREKLMLTSDGYAYFMKKMGA